MSSLLAGLRPTNWGHHLYHSKVDRDLSHDRHTHINTDISLRAYGLRSLSQIVQFFVFLVTSMTNVYSMFTITDTLITFHM